MSRHRHRWIAHPPEQTIYGFRIVSPDTCSGCYMVRFVESIMNKSRYYKRRADLIQRERFFRGDRP